MRKWRQGSEFGEGERVPLDREQRAVIKARLKMGAFRGPGRLTANAVSIGELLLEMLGKDGALFPSIATLLARTGIRSASTVVLALKRLRQFGFLTWARRLIRVGSRVRQNSNAYAFCCDAGRQQEALRDMILPVPLTERTARASAERGSGAVSGAIDPACLALRERRMAAFNAAWWAKRSGGQ